ncbi:hypothetical protein QJS10_CPB19g00726 [Acorus calamus]|uniref:Uncharacterized protein n=1 Tax=Acorus calamus TaxID=4465 RepID=A0AAV9CGT5_ACOCL|nr:hypothetical protein QJS10_CPB19g00726 [Acorus calamus]
MLLHANYGFTIFAKCILKFIHKEASRLGPEYQMVRITVKLDDITKLKYEEGSVLAKCATLGLETVEHNSSLGVDEDTMCSIYLERLFMDDFTNNEAVIIMCAYVSWKLY